MVGYLVGSGEDDGVAGAGAEVPTEDGEDGAEEDGAGGLDGGGVGLHHHGGLLVGLHGGHLHGGGLHGLRGEGNRVKKVPYETFEAPFLQSFGNCRSAKMDPK